MAKVPFFGDGGSPYAWTVVKIGGKYLPGVATVTGSVGRAVKTDMEPGKDGYTYNHLGYKPAEVSVSLKLWTPEHLATWIEMAKILRPRKGEKDMQPVDVIHPALETVGIRSLYVTSVGIPEPCGEPQVYQVKLEFAEFIPEAKRKTRPKKAKTSSSVVNVKADLSTLPTAHKPSSAPPGPG